MADQPTESGNTRLRNVRPEILRARDLRANQSTVEQFLWSKVRGRRFAGYRFVRQLPIGPYFADFVCRERMLILELDGGQHNTDEAREHDARRTAYLQEEGYQVLRFWNHNVVEDWDVVAEVVVRALEARVQKET